MPFSSVLGAQSVVKPGVCTSSTRPAAPYDGQVVYLTDTDQTLVWDGTAWAVLAPIAGGRNAVINGSFNVWQRSTDATTVGSYSYATADRWISRTAAGGGSVRVSRQAATDLTGFRYCARVQRTASNTNTGALQIIHTLETANSIPFAGKTVTLSFYARKGANYSPTSSGMNPQLYSGTGTDQHWTSFTSQSTAIAQTAVLSATWQRFSYSATIASTATQLYMIFEMVPTGTAGADDWFEIAGIQLEAGAVATPFEVEDVGTTLEKCQRYFERIQPLYEYQMLATGFVTATTNGAFCLFYETKRVAPSSITFSSAGTFAINNSPDVATTVTNIGINASRIGTKSANIHASVASGLTVGQGCHLNARTPASSTYIDISAEL